MTTCKTFGKRHCVWGAQKPCEIRADSSIDFQSLTRSFSPAQKDYFLGIPTTVNLRTLAAATPVPATPQGVLRIWPPSPRRAGNSSCALHSRLCSPVSEKLLSGLLFVAHRREKEKRGQIAQRGAPLSHGLLPHPERRGHRLECSVGDRPGIPTVQRPPHHGGETHLPLTDDRGRGHLRSRHPRRRRDHGAIVLPVHGKVTMSHREHIAREPRRGLQEWGTARPPGAQRCRHVREHELAVHHGGGHAVQAVQPPGHTGRQIEAQPRQTTQQPWAEQRAAPDAPAPSRRRPVGCTPRCCGSAL